MRATWTVLASFLTACSFESQGGPGNGPGAGSTTTIDEYISSLPYLGVDDASVDMGESSAPHPDGEIGRASCRERVCLGV